MENSTVWISASRINWSAGENLHQIALLTERELSIRNDPFNNNDNLQS